MIESVPPKFLSFTLARGVVYKTMGYFIFFCKTDSVIWCMHPLKMNFLLVIFVFLK